MSNDFSEKVKSIREYSRLSQQKFVDAVGIPLASYKRYETGATSPTASTLKAILEYKDYKKFTLWLMTGDTDPSSGQISPETATNTQPQSLISREEFHDKFVSEVAESMKMFGYLGWIEVNTDKIDFEACGKLVFKEVEPIIEGHFGSSLKSKVG
ncbi:helix-turn-helix transcriptional regulator [Pseudoalteromonas sp. BZB3]|uniref:helix-turn-helix domain-containing protein n=1 Tax=Pseudoalteromonas sp. BZB3 TaxID=3136670 RepID=UPI0032C446FD